MNGIDTVVFLVVGLPLICVVILATVFFLLNLRNLLRQVSPQNRTMQPDYVWLNLIPLFGYAWMIITVMRVRDSVRAEFKSRGWSPQGDFGFGVGLAFAILAIVSGLLTFIPMLVCWIIYWAKTSELARQLAQTQPPAGWALSPSPRSYGQSLASDASSGTQTLALQPPRQTCSSCGALAQPGDTYCRSCGERLEVQASVDQLETSTTGQAGCPYCGAANRPTALFCSTCGRSVARP